MNFDAAKPKKVKFKVNVEGAASDDLRYMFRVYFEGVE